MNNYRVSVVWVDDDVTTVWVDARSEQHACFLVGTDFNPDAVDSIRTIYAVIETN